MTYGEAHVAEKNSIDLVHGEWIQTLHVDNKPKPMQRADAVKYYNTKLFVYWMNRLKDDISIIRKKQIVALFMFGHTDRHQLFKEPNNECIQ